MATYKYQSRQNWLEIRPGHTITWPQDGPVEVWTVIKATVAVTVYGASVDANGEVGDKFLVAYLLPGEDRPLRVSHGTGLQLLFDFPKGECWVYDDREPMAATAPVGESFTRFEKLGHRIEDPMQVILHRDSVRKRLERLQNAGKPDEREDRIARLEKSLESMTKIVADYERREKGQENADVEEQANGKVSAE